MAKPGSSPDRLEFYRPQDFAIGARIEVFKHKFITTDADEFPTETLNSLRRKHNKLPPEQTKEADKK